MSGRGGGEQRCFARAARPCLREAVGMQGPASSGEVMHTEGILREPVEIGNPTPAPTKHAPYSRDD
eukprot:4989873-Alexandrium_andersonii.AAC.1